MLSAFTEELQLGTQENKTWNSWLNCDININIVMKLNVQQRYDSEIKKSNNTFIIIQNFSTYCYKISAPWRILIGNGGKQDIKFLRKKTAL